MSSIQGEDEIDRISDLPDSILGKILSRLPTKNVVATQILSTRWKNLFPILYVHLDLDSSYPKSTREPNPTAFIAFLDKLFNAGTTLFDLSRVETVRIYWKKGFCSDVKFLNNLSLPKLKTLELRGLSIYEPLQGLIDSCPALEDLSLVRFTFLGSVFIIRSNVLKELTISKGSRFEMMESFELDTPNLQMLTCNYFAPGVKGDGFSVTSFKSLSMAHIDVYPFVQTCRGKFGHGVSEILAACASTSRLYLGSFAITKLHTRSGQFSTFHNLTWLGLGYLQPIGWVVFGHLLASAPNLKELICEEGFLVNERDPGYYSSRFADFAWSASDPICLELHLEKIEFWGFYWTDFEMKLLEYFLTKGKVLEKLIIRGERFMDNVIRNKFRSLPNHSKVVFEKEM